MSKVKKFIQFITFTNIPIKKKFILFLLGVLFWFVVMLTISMTSSFMIDSRTDKIVNHLIPHERLNQKIIKKLQSLSIDISEIKNISDTENIYRKIDIARARIADILSFTDILSHGGQAPDINRDNNIVIENISIPPYENDPYIDAYTKAIEANVNAIASKITAIEEIKRGIPANMDKGDLDSVIDETKKLLIESISLSDSFSANEASSYAVNSKSIKNVLKIMTFTFIGVFFIATALLIVFTVSISRSIAKPVKAIIKQIRLVAEGRVDMTNKIKVVSKDEIGVLTQDFNDFMDEINDLDTFKQVIEEDDSLEDVYSRLANVFNRYGLDDFIIYEISNSQNKMKTVFPIIMNEDDINCNPEILHDCSLCKVKKTGHIISSFDYTTVCKQFKTDVDKIHVCIPMLISGTVGGVVQLLFNKKYDKDKRVYKAEQYINEACPVIEAKRLTNTLRESSLKDALTGLYNRRFLQEYTETLIAGALRRNKNIGLIMCDLDYFKQINDVYGHNVGDEVLKNTSNVIRQCVRGSDLVIRFGGEEFLLIALDVEENETMEIAEKIRKTMEETKIKVSDGIIKKTISLGISEFPKDTDAFWQAIKYADVALYKAKDTGRNKAVRFTKDMWKENEF